MLISQMDYDEYICKYLVYNGMCWVIKLTTIFLTQYCNT